MKRGLTQIFGLALIPLLLLALPRTGSAVTLGFKFFGGYNFMNGGDINEGLKGTIDMAKAEAAMNGVTINGDYKAFHGGMDVGGDLIIYFAPMVGIGIGASYIQAQSSSEFTFSIPPGTVKMTLKPQVTALPLRAGLYFAIPMGSLVNLTLNAGAEYYLARVEYTERSELLAEWHKTETKTDSKGKIGYCGGLGLEIKLHPNLSVILEGRGRYARVDGFEGNSRSTSSSDPPTSYAGKLYFLRIDAGAYGQFSMLIFNDTPIPPDPDTLVNRSARLELNGFSALAGIMFKF